MLTRLTATELRRAGQTTGRPAAFTSIGRDLLRVRNWRVMVFGGGFEHAWAEPRVVPPHPLADRLPSGWLSGLGHCSSVTKRGSRSREQRGNTVPLRPEADPGSPGAFWVGEDASEEM